MDNTRVFITGGTGALGSNLINSFPANYQILAPTSMECNILEYEKLERLLQEFNPSIIVHAAAYDVKQILIKQYKTIYKALST